MGEALKCILSSQNELRTCGLLKSKNGREQKLLASQEKYENLVGEDDGNLVVIICEKAFFQG